MKILTRGNIYKNFFCFAFPIVLSGLLSEGYSTINTVIAGYYIGETGLAAIGATAPLISFLSSIFWGFGNGTGVYIARLFGAGEYGKIRRVINTHHLAVAAFVLAIAIPSILFTDPILRLLRVDEAVMQDAATYFRIMMAGFVVIRLSANCGYPLHALGIGGFTFYMSLVTAILTVGGNILSVAVFDMGVAGIALSTIFAAAVTFVCYLFRFRRVYREMGLPRGERLSIRDQKDALPYALPVTFQQMMMYFATLALSPIVNGIGGAATAAYTVVIRVYDINASVYQNSARAVGSYTAQCMGEGRADKIKRGIFAGLVQGVLFLLPFVGVMLMFPDQTLSLFFKENASPEAISYAWAFIRIYLPFVFFNLINNLFHNLYRGVKKMSFLIASTTTASLVRILIGLVLAPMYGMHGFYIAWVASWIYEALLSFVIYITGIWKPHELRQQI